MYNASIDPEYYADEPHGYWMKSADYERKQQQAIEAKRAVREGRACWVAGPLGQNDKPDELPF